MTEKEKMCAGLPYLANDSDLAADRLKAKVMIKNFNEADPRHHNARKKYLISLFHKTPSKFYIEPPFRCDYGYNISIGENFYANYNLTILDGAAVTIGDNVMIGPNVSIYTAGHPVHYTPRNAGWEFALPIHIGDNVWIGGNVVINPGIAIGNNAVIGSGSVVTRNIPANVVAAGNPCRIIREIHAEEINQSHSGHLIP